MTPTQRVHRQVKKLQQLLNQARRELEEKDSDILKLTKEVVELRIYKAALNSPEESNSSDAVTVRENNTDEQITPENAQNTSQQHNEMNDSYTDSGHFDDFSNSPVRIGPSGSNAAGRLVPVMTLTDIIRHCATVLPIHEILTAQ